MALVTVPMIGWFISPVIAAVIKRADELLESKIKSKNGAQKQLHRLKDELLPTVEGVIDHIMESQSKNVAVRNWIGQLKDALYDAEDLLEQARVDVALGNDTRLLGLYYPIATKMKKINKRMVSILKKGQELGLLDIAQSSRQVSSSVPLKIRETTSILDVDFPMIGRENITHEIVNMLVQHISSSGSHYKLSVLTIVGMGGVGKTTLIRHVFNDEDVKRFFKLRLWVCVGMRREFNVNRVTIDIINSIDDHTAIDSHGRTHNSYDSRALESLQTILQSKIREEQPFLLILDDAWDADSNKWDELLKPLKAFGKCCWVIVTTREHAVANVVRRELEPMCLDCMNEEDMWAILKIHAFPGDHGVNVNPHLEKMGRKIVQRLKGLPLAAKTVGTILKGRREPKEWETILKSELLAQGQNKNDMMSILMLSYYSLPTYLRQCFSYLSLFPKDYEFGRYYDYDFLPPYVVTKFGGEVDIMMQWMAHNFFKHGDVLESMENTILTRGFVELVNRSLIQLNKDKGIGFTRYGITMHDLIHDLAEMVSEEECYRENDDANMKLTFKVRHMSFFAFKKEKSTSALWRLVEFKMLRTLLFDVREEVFNGDFLDICFQSLTCLRVLSLRNGHIKSLPDSIGNLKLLRYLNPELPYIKELPETTSQLYNLLVLKLDNCQMLCASPKCMSKLVSLEYMDAKNEFMESISGIGALTNLQRLNLKSFAIREEYGFRISELKNLNMLSGSFCIKNIEKIKDQKSAREAQLHRKKDLQELHLVWGHHLQQNELEQDIGQLDVDVLEGLCPNDNLKKIYIKGYMGKHLPKWLQSQYLTSLEGLNISKCRNLTYIGFLPSMKLRHCELQNVNNGERSILLEEVYTNSGFHNYEEEVSLSLLDLPSSSSSSTSQLVAPSSASSLYLQKLEIEDCHNLDDCLNALLRGLSLSLQYLRICGYSHKLGDLSHLTSLKELQLSECLGEVILDPTALSSLGNLVIWKCPGVAISSRFIEPCSSMFPELQRLGVGGCSMEQLGDLLLVVAKSPLKSLFIDECNELIHFEGDLESHFLQLTTLEILFINSCRNIRSLPTDLRGFKALRSLMILSCPEISPEVECQFPDSLDFNIHDCPKWKEHTSEESE